MFRVIRHYHFDRNDSAEIDRLIQDEFVPIIRKASVLSATRGWIRGPGRARPSASSRTRPAPTRSVRLAADFVRTKMSKLLREKPEIIEGPIKAHDRSAVDLRDRRAVKLDEAIWRW